MAFSKARRLSDFIASDGTIPTGKFASGTITSTHLADGTVAPADLHSSLDLTGKTVTVANASTGDSDTTAANTAFVQQEIAALVDSSPSALNTLNELAAALGDDANFSTTVTNSIATKLPLAGGSLTGALDITAAGNQLTLSRSGFDDILFGTGTANGQVGFHITNSTDSIVPVSLHENAPTATLVVGSTGNVGIGMSSPSAKLHLATTGSEDIALGLQNSERYYKIHTDGGNLRFTDVSAGLVERMSIDSSGNVGIFGGGILQLSTTTGATRGYISAQELNVNGTHAAGLVIATSNGESITFKDNTNTNMIINGVGDVMIGNTVVNPASGFANQKGFGYNNGQGSVEIAVTSDVPVLQLGRNVATTSGSAIIFRKSSNTYGSIGVEGGDSFVVAGNGASSAGIHMHPSQNAVVPAQGNARAATNTKDLGRSATSWRNIYLGTGIVQPDNTHTLQHSGGTDTGYKFNLGFIRGGSGGYNHIKTNLPYNGNVMIKFEFDGWTYSGTNYHESVTFYTYNGQSGSPYNLSYADWGTGGGIANVYYSSDGYVVIVIEAHVNYTGGFLYAQCGRGHYVSDMQILATGSNSTTSGVF